MYALNLSEDNRILSVCVVLPIGYVDEEGNPTNEENGIPVYDIVDGKYHGMPVVETLPDGDVTDYKYIDGVYVYEPLPKADDNSTRIVELKQMLADTDYIVIKIAEGVATWDEYPGVKEQRQAWREEINKLEQTSTTE